MARVLSQQELADTGAKLGTSLKTLSQTSQGNISTRGLPTNTGQQYGAFNAPTFLAPTPGRQRVLDSRQDSFVEAVGRSGVGGIGIAAKKATEWVAGTGYDVGQQALRLGRFASNRYGLGEAYDGIVDKISQIASAKSKELDERWGNGAFWEAQTNKLVEYDQAPNDLEDWITTANGIITPLTLGAGTFVKGGVVGAVRGMPGVGGALFKKQLAGLIGTAGRADTAIVNKAFSQLIKTPVPKSPGLGRIAIERAATSNIKDRALRGAANAMTANYTWKATADRTAAILGGSEGAKQIAKDVAIELALRAPMRRENMRFATDVVESYHEGNYFNDGDKIGAIPGTVLAASFMLNGGPLGALTRNLPKAGQKIKGAFYNENTYFDLVFKGLNLDGQFAEGVRQFMATAPRELADDGARALRSVQAMNLSKASAYHAAHETIRHLQYTNPGKQFTAKEVVEQMVKYNHLQRKLEAVQSKAKDGEYFILARFDRETQAKIADEVQGVIKVQTAKLGKGQKLSFEQKKALARDYVMAQIEKGAYWAQNKEVVDEILKGIERAKRTESLYLNIKNTTNTWPVVKGISKLQKEFHANGYVAVKVPAHKVTKFRESNIPVRSITESLGDMYIEKANIAKPIFRTAGAALTKMGLGLEDTAKVAYDDVRDGTVAYISERIGRDEEFSKKVLRAIEQYTANEKYAHGIAGKAARRTITDSRQMTVGEILTALKDAGIKDVSKEQAKAIRHSIVQAHLDLPLRMNGMANWLIAKSYRYNPAFKYYTRVQGAGRYTFNPFFKLQTNVESEVLGQAAVQGKKPWIMGMGTLFPGQAKKLDEVVDVLEKQGLFRAHGMGGLASYGAEDALIGRINTVLTQTEKRNLATTVQKMANRMGMSAEELILRHPQDVMDVVRPIFQYPTTGILNSSLMKALNVAIFPARYNIKVATLATQYLSKQPPAVQVLTINKLWEFESWLKSDEGIMWQRENQEAISFLKWLTPIGSVQWVFDVLNKPFGSNSEIQGVGDLGALGGLPFGVITQILDSQGIIKINAPYVSPEDGEIYAKYIPESMKAKMTSAVTDLLGSTFSYPGRTVGLPGKGQGLRGAAGAIGLDPSMEEWNYVSRDKDELNQLGQRKVELWQQAYLEAYGVNPPVNTESAQRQYSNVVDKKILPQERMPYLNKSQLLELKRSQAKAKAKTEKPTKTINGQTVRVKPSAVSGPFANQ